MPTLYWRQGLTGGSANDLDGIDGATLVDLDGAVVITGSYSYFYSLDADSGESESSPDIIAPDLNPGNKRWILQNAYQDTLKISKLYASDGDPEAVSVDASGNVGIGTAAPDELLHLVKNTDGGCVLVIDNQNASTNTYGAIEVRNGSDHADSCRLGTLGSGWYTLGGFLQDGGFISAEENLSGGLSIMTRANAPIRFYTNGHLNERARIDGSGNVGLGVNAFGTSAAKVLGLGAGTAPTTAPADMAQMWVENIAGTAGKAGLHMMSESGTEKLIVAGIVRKTTTGDPSQVHEGLMCINTNDNTIKMYGDGAWRTLASW